MGPTGERAFSAVRQLLLTHHNTPALKLRCLRVNLGLFFCTNKRFFYLLDGRPSGGNEGDKQKGWGILPSSHTKPQGFPGCSEYEA